MTAQYRVSGQGFMITASTLLQDGTGGSYANGDAGNTVTFGPAAGDYVMLGFLEKFDDINIVLNTTATGSFTYTVEYPTAVNSDGTPSAWTAFPSITDGTSNATASGKIHFDASLATGWIPCYSKAGGGGLLVNAFSPNGAKGYYVRIKTLTAGTRTPIATTIKCCDYTNQANNWTWTTPKWNNNKLPGDVTGFDLDGDGYLNDTEYAAASSPNNGGAANPVRWRYHRALPSMYGTNNLFTNFGDINVQAWESEAGLATITAQPQYDGLFLDDSGESDVTHVIEDGTQAGASYGAVLKYIWRVYASRAFGTENSSSQHVGRDRRDIRHPGLLA